MPHCSGLFTRFGRSVSIANFAFLLFLAISPLNARLLLNPYNTFSDHKSLSRHIHITSFSTSS